MSERKITVFWQTVFFNKIRGDIMEIISKVDCDLYSSALGVAELMKTLHGA